MSIVGPTIVTTALAAGHDGRAEIVLELRYPNGGVSRLSLSQEALARALDTAGLDRLDQLRGQPWTVLVPAGFLDPTDHPTKGTTCSI